MNPLVLLALAHQSNSERAPSAPHEHREHAPTAATPDERTEPALFHTLDVLDVRDCRAVQHTVHDLQAHWIKRSCEAPFYTLGSASYMDARDDYRHYQSLAKRYNPLLRRHLGWLYDRLAEVLSHHLGAPAIYDEEHALPGFHIYLGCGLFERPVASIHYDSQYELLQWRDQDEADFTDPRTFTLVIALPRNGGGLHYWDMHYEQWHARRQEPLRTLLAQRRRHYYPYRLGTVVVHSGHTLHQVAPGRGLQIDDERITLQGHALRRGDRWELYW